ncbi:hypothetical protein [Amycolatopsis pigmentata]|uniref:Uncharacterized protein n=1 Tax=Amycolatopsis pigmentata TaxID=450801 RepID=A0ABW5G4I2_9PSEU
MADESSAKRRSAFDIRMIIALLIGVYGVVLTIMGIGFTTPETIAKAAGVNINLWAGIGMLIGAALFVLWTVLRPVRVVEEPPATE